MVRVATVHARLAAVVAGLELLRSEAALSDPELALCRAAGEDEVCEFLDLLSKRLVSRLVQAGGAVARAARHSNQDVGPGPPAFGIGRSELREIHFELGRAMGERGAFFLDGGISDPAQPRQILRRAGKAIVIGRELESSEKTMDLQKMVGRVRVDEQV